ncbi:MAG: hypothetical protein A2261_02020 [Candidatus Magasanikbacteria bacterium RIFOXYA2_FULL_44_8]|uniref:Methyltransferase type 11 domain-containing protein n=1 Tax=Candidatus Magasanikbacteria bacterium RIFOXYA2_FULL_44_8 TaxID=1798696 RepID=A0A1F6NLL8_9BACT|nr:MAG: hypothetical protein A2261_02020 [Candidatus Magasanikbacteria bacterium RIFOXYA2_FULL_44_8]
MATKIKIFPSDSGYDLAAARYDEKESYLNSFEKNHVFDLLGDLSGKKVLDVGAGTGRLTLELSQRGALVTALDVSGKMLQVLTRNNPRIEIKIGDAEDLPFADNTFDIVVAAFLIVHLKDLTRFFDEAYRVLKDGGKLLVTNINQKEPPEIKTKEGVIKIESYYHRPEKVREILEQLAFGIGKEVFVKVKDVWVNQIVLAIK